MIAEGIWKSKGKKLREVHAWRPQRSHYGELVQWDTSDHDWLEGRGEPVQHLVRMIDDATSRSWGRFVPRDGTRENMGVLWEYVKRFGRAVDYYTDRDSMFAVAARWRVIRQSGPHPDAENPQHERRQTPPLRPIGSPSLENVDRLGMLMTAAGLGPDISVTWDGSRLYICHDGSKGGVRASNCVKGPFDTIGEAVEVFSDPELRQELHRRLATPRIDPTRRTCDHPVR